MHVDKSSASPYIARDNRLTVSQLNLAFTISVVVNNIGALPTGILLDHLGPRKTSLIGAVLFGLGNICMALDSHRFGTASDCPGKK